MQLASGDAEDALVTLLALLCCLVILLTVCLPPLLWVELAVAPRPVSRRMRALLIGQGLVALVGVALTAFGLALTLCHFGFGAETDPESAGFYLILAAEVVFAPPAVSR